MASDEVRLTSARLELGPWGPADTPAALTIFGSDEVTHWLTPAMQPVRDDAEMAAALGRWIQEDAEAEPPVGHWAVRREQDGVVIGSITLRRMPPFHEDLELAWAVQPGVEAFVRERHIWTGCGRRFKSDSP